MAYNRPLVAQERVTTSREVLTPQAEVIEKTMQYKVAQASQHVQGAEAETGPLKAGLSDLGSFVMSLPAVFEAFKDSAINLATYLRNTITRAIRNVKQCWTVIVKLYEISEEIGHMFAEAHTMNLWGQIESLNDMVKVSLTVVPLFETLVEQFQKGCEYFKVIQEKVLEFFNKVQNMTKEAIVELQRAFAQIQAGLKAMVCRTWGKIRQQTSSMLTAVSQMCSPPDPHLNYVKPEVVSRGLGVEGSIFTNPRFQGVLRSCIGDEGNKLLFDMMVQNHWCGKALQKEAKELDDKIQEFKAPPETAFEWFISPFDKIFSGIDLAFEFSDIFNQLPGIWAVLKTNINNFLDYCKRLQEWWLDMWNGFMQVVVDLCAKIGVELSPEYGNDEALHVDFDEYAGTFQQRDFAETIIECTQCACCVGVKDNVCLAYSHCYWGLYNAYSQCYWGIAERCCSGTGRRIRVVEVSTS